MGPVRRLGLVELPTLGTLSTERPDNRTRDEKSRLQVRSLHYQVPDRPNPYPAGIPENGRESTRVPFTVNTLSLGADNIVSEEQTFGELLSRIHRSPNVFTPCDRKHTSGSTTPTYIVTSTPGLPSKQIPDPLRSTGFYRQGPVNGSDRYRPLGSYRLSRKVLHSGLLPRSTRYDTRRPPPPSLNNTEGP